MCTKFGTAVGVVDLIICDKFWWSVQGCRFCRGSKISLSDWLSQSLPLTLGWRYRAARDALVKCFFSTISPCFPIVLVLFLFTALPKLSVQVSCIARPSCCTTHGGASIHFTLGRPFPKNCLFPQRIWIPSNTWFLGPVRAHNPYDISIGSAAFAQLTAECPYTRQWAAPSPKIANFHGDLHPQIIQDSLGLPESTTQTVFRSVQLSLQSSRPWQTDRPTDIQTDRQEDHANRSVTIGRIYVRSAVMRPNYNNTSGPFVKPVGLGDQIHPSQPITSWLIQSAERSLPMRRCRAISCLLHFRFLLINIAFIF